MTDNKEVMIEISFFCGICLSTGRALKPLGDYLEIFANIMVNTKMSTKLSPQIQLCWECRAVLCRTWCLRKRALKAWHTLQSIQANGLKNLPKESFSTLVTTILPHNEFVNDEESKAFIKRESPTDFDNHASGDEDHFQNRTDDLKLEMEETLKMEFGTIKAEPASPEPLTVNLVKKKMSRGSIKKAKFRTITLKNRNKEVKDYVKLKISHDELLQYLNRERLKNHYVIKPYKCESCILGWKRKAALLRHNNEYHVKSRGRYVCDICNMRCSQKNAVLQHVQKHYFKHRCLICNEDFYEKERIFYHMSSKHWDVTLHECLECGLQFNSRREFYKHYNELHRCFNCDVCGKSCSTKRKIIRHLQETHEPLYCKICDVRFKAYKYYRSHKLTVHMKQISEDSYCVECNLQFDNVSKYKRHLANSVKHKPKKKLSIPCPECQKIFCKKITMKNHYNLVHLRTSKHYCDACDRYFLNGWRYRQHKASVHDKIAPVKNKFCDICGRAFAQNRTLINHIRTHTGEKPFVCSQCPARFAQRTAMLTHFKAIHQKNKVFQ